MLDNAVDLRCIQCSMLSGSDHSMAFNQCLNAHVRTQVRSMPYSHVRALRELHFKRSSTDLRPGEAKRIGRTGREPISRTGEVKSSSGRAAMFVAAKTFFVRNLEISPHSNSNFILIMTRAQPSSTLKIRLDPRTYVPVGLEGPCPTYVQPKSILCE